MSRAENAPHPIVFDPIKNFYQVFPPKDKWGEKDLELVRAYAGTTLPAEEGNGTPDTGLVVSQAVHFGSTSNGAIGPALFQEEANFENAGFNLFTGRGPKGLSTSKSTQGVSAKFSGTFHKKAKFSSFNNTWRIDAIGAITSGRSNVKKNAVVVTFNSYGAVAKKLLLGEFLRQIGRHRLSKQLQAKKIRQPSIEIGPKYGRRKYTPVTDRDLSFYSYLRFDYFYN